VDVAGRLLDRPDFGVTHPCTPELPDARKVGSRLRQKRRSGIASEKQKQYPGQMATLGYAARTHIGNLPHVC
jgi:hypothetical protein